MSVNGGGVFEGEVGGGGVALGGAFAEQGLAVGIEVGLHPTHFSCVVLIAAAFETRGQAHFHFGIDAAGERGVGMEVVYAAAHFEEVERVVHEFFGGGARGERAVVEVAPVEPAETCGDGG